MMSFLQDWPVPRKGKKKNNSASRGCHLTKGQHQSSTKNL